MCRQKTIYTHAMLRYYCIMSKHLTPTQKTEATRLRTEEKLTAPQIALRLGISNWAAYEYTKDHPLSAEDMRERRHNTTRSWTKAELASLRRLWSTKDRLALERALPRRRWSSISKRASEIGLHRPRIITHKKVRVIDPLFIELRAIREANNIIREELSEHIGIHRQMLAHYELGQTIPRWANFRAWLEALGCEIKIIQPRALT